MLAVWIKTKTAREIATIGLTVGCEFDRKSGNPIEVLTFTCAARLRHL